MLLARALRLQFSAAVIPMLGAGAQLITPKTVPIAQGDQFNVFPAANAAMGGVSIAVDDSLGDPWSNPARIARLRTAHLIASPIFYSISDDAGAGRTLPLAVYGAGGPWSVGAVAALQQVDGGNRNQWWGPQRVSDRSALNRYAGAAVGRRFETAGISVGASLFGASLGGVDAVDQLYANAERVEQSGGLVDARIGLSKEWRDGRSLDVVGVYDRFAMTHDAFSTVWLWPPIDPIPVDTIRPIGPWPEPVRIDSIEHNEDRSITWGGHARYTIPLSADGWRVGLMGTYNKIEHPKIPNYTLQNIPRDPGSTRAFNLGVGFSRARNGTTLGLDVVYEPMWSETWADAERDTPRAGGGVIRRGERTVENDFTFSNTIVRLGVGHDTPATPGSASLGIQAGVSMRAIDYRLRQDDNVARTRRTQREDWVEWSPSVGVGLRFPELELRYALRSVLGVNRPGGSPGVFLAEVGAPRAGGVIAAPSGPLVMTPVRVVSHQMLVSVPIR